jgi:hypothetical protein
MDPFTASLIVGGASKLASLPSSYSDQMKLERRLKSLQGQPMSRYTIDPKIENLYRQSIGEASNPEGFGGATTSNFRQQLARMQRARFGAARSMGGGARGINAVLAGQELDQLNQFAVGDENLRRSNRLGALGRAGSYAGQFQAMRDRNTSFDQNYRLQLERALGQSIASQKDYRRNMLSGMGSDLITTGISGMMGGNAMDKTN